MSFNEDWKEVELKDVAKYSDERIDIEKLKLENYISTSNMLANKNGVNEAESLPKLNSATKYEENDILISNIRPYFKKIWFSNTSGGSSNDVLIIKTKNGLIYERYLYYYLSQNHFFDYMMQGAKGTKMPRGDKSSIMKYKIKFPKDAKEQKFIAGIFSTLDKKIENNNKMNKTLEEMAQAIYKSWFVDFEPFQDGKFVESELGMIPNNIELKPLKDFFSVKTGKKNANIATDDGDYAFFTCSQGMRRTNVYSFDDTAILLAGNGDFNVKWYRGKFEAYQRTYVLIPNVTELFSFLYYSIDYFLDKLILGQRGSVISYLTKGMVEELKIPIMKDENMFNDIIKRLNNINYLIEKNENENRTLKKLRDSLLPKLMSGEIRVPLDDNAKEVN